MSQFLRPATVEEAVQMKKDNPGALYLGGGCWINNGARKGQGESLISLETLALKSCEKKDGAYVLGAGLTFQQMLDWKDCYAPLKDALMFMSSRNMRNQATLGGDIGAGAERACLLPLLLALNADLELAGGERLALEDYLKNYPKAGEGPLILNVRFSPGKGHAEVKQVRKSAGGLVVLSAAVWMESKDMPLNEARIFVGGTVEGIQRLKGLGGALGAGSEGNLEKAVASLVKMEGDLKGSKEYKSYVCGVAVSDCVRSCREALK